MSSKPGITKRALAFWLIVGGLIGWQLNTAFSNETQITTFGFDGTVEEELDLRLFWDVWEKVSSNYIDYDEIDDEQEVYGAISGMVSSLGDPYTVFLPPQEQKSTKDELNGSFEGVGIQLEFDKDKLEGKVLAKPERDDIDLTFEEHLVVEYYSKL